ncbi:MAG: hypothetical protein ACI9EW_003902 [Cellvibrionaceae bacterium]|jgi:hypothetical protein
MAPKKTFFPSFDPRRNIPMHTTLPNFTHIVGWHCSSTSISNAAKFDGIPMSEAMAFGLGAGLGFQYWDIPANSPRYSFNGRASGLERKFFEHIGHPAVWAAEWSPAKMADVLANGRPILCVTDIYGSLGIQGVDPRCRG